MNTNKTAIVTGASRGIGKAIALGLAKDGYKVAALARNGAALKELAPAGIIPVQVDLADFAATEDALNNIIKDFGHVDVLVNNAGIVSKGTLEVPLKTFEEVLKVNLVSPFQILQKIVPLMLRAGSGMILNVSSRAGKIGFPGIGAYAASKFGLVGLNESLYNELVPKGIKVTALCPSWVDTQMAQDAGTPLKNHEMIQPEDLMRTVRWLLSLSPAACVKEVMIECGGNLN